jgi:diacylglycerol O-acyltransferase / wax synthase
MERLSGLDASFLYLETPTHHMHVALTLVFDPRTIPGGFSFERMKTSIAARIPVAPVFRRRLVEVPFRLGHPVWIDDPDFDIDYHVRLAAVPRPGGLHELAELAGDIAGRQLDRSRPLWEMWIVEGLSGGRIGMIAKMHHSTVDGVSGAELLSVLFDVDPQPDQPPLALDEDADGRVPSGLELVGQALVARSMRPWEMARDIVRTGRKVLSVRNVRVGSGQRATPGKAALPLSAPRISFNTALTRRRSVALAAIGLEDVKTLKRATGTTVNDVVLAICCGALRSYLLEGDELPDKPLVAVVPISVRPDIDSPKGSNQVSAMFVQLPVNLEDPMKRLMAVHEGTEGAKEEHDALGADMLLNWAEHATPNVFASAARLYSRMRLANVHRPIANVVISNVLGPDFPLYLAGAELEAGFPLGPVMDGMGVNITVMSYRGVLYWGVISCPETVPTVWRITDAVQPALDELLRAAGLEAAADRPDLTVQEGPDTAIDDAPSHTGIGDPNVWVTGE